MNARDRSKYNFHARKLKSNDKCFCPLRIVRVKSLPCSYNCWVNCWVSWYSRGVQARGEIIVIGFFILQNKIVQKKCAQPCIASGCFRQILCKRTNGKWKHNNFATIMIFYCTWHSIQMVITNYTVLMTRKNIINVFNYRLYPATLTKLTNSRQQFLVRPEKTKWNLNLDWALTPSIMTQFFWFTPRHMGWTA